MIHLTRVIEILQSIADDPALLELAQRGEPNAGSLREEAVMLCTALTARRATLTLPKALASLHRLRGYCDWEPLNDYQGLLDDAIQEVTQTAMLSP